MKKARILFSPLNWGLGHAVRSVPILRELSERGYEIILAGDGFALEFLRKEFPTFQSLSLPSFVIRYSRRNSQIIAILKAFPKIVFASWKEHRQLQRLIKEWDIDLVISDNRFGLFTKKIPSIYITHQLTVRMPAGFRFLEPLVRKIHRLIISTYTYCWIPDEPGSLNLSGDLSHNQDLPNNARFIGVLSRFQESEFSPDSEKKYDFLFLLSGIEPQRSMLENKIKTLFSNQTDCRAILVRGIPGLENEPDLTEDLKIINQTSGEELKSLLAKSDIVVCRSGYTSAMELAAIGKKAILIPTPGQPEQEYLGDYLSAYPLFSCVKQDELTESTLFSAAKKLEKHSFAFTSQLLADAIDDLERNRIS